MIWCIAIVKDAKPDFCGAALATEKKGSCLQTGLFSCGVAQEPPDTFAQPSTLLRHDRFS
jgi:hypothetical protein